MIGQSAVADPLRSSAPPGLRVVVAGVGLWGRSWIDVVQSSPICELVALVDLDQAALEHAASSAGISRAACFATVTDAAAAVTADAVLVVVPPAAHTAVALEALDAGLHCLIEKPFATTLADARVVVERGDAAGRVVMVSQQYRYRPGARTVQRLVADGAIGRVGAASIRFSQVLTARGFQHKMDEPLLHDMAIHHFDLIRAVLAVEPVSVLATSHNPRWSPFAGNADATAVFEVSDGTAVWYEGSWAPRGPLTAWDGAWEIHGDDGSIHWDGHEVLVQPRERPTIAKIERRVLRREWRGRRIRPARIEYPDRGGSLAELRSAIHAGREAETSARDNIRSLALTLAAVESARRRAAVDLEELLADD